LLKRLEAKKHSPEANIFYAYASLQVLKQAADAAQSLDPALVSKAMHSGITFDTMIGRFAFNQKGDRKDEDFAVYIWKKGSDGKFSFFER
jgi:branched-chain amino acid transport system substrate-binding protein